FHVLAPSDNFINRKCPKKSGYLILNDALDSNSLLRFPNLDKVLPLPPAPLPPWTGDKQTLIDAAKGGPAPSADTQPSAAAQK
ncbi:DUF6396 domain-containing protein, partial [Pseudoduganella buxea]